MVLIHQRHDRQTDRPTDDMRSQDRALHCSASCGKNVTYVFPLNDKTFLRVWHNCAVYCFFFSFRRSTVGYFRGVSAVAFDCKYVHSMQALFIIARSSRDELSYHVITGSRGLMTSWAGTRSRGCNGAVADTLHRPVHAICPSSLVTGATPGQTAAGRARCSTTC